MPFKKTVTLQTIGDALGLTSHTVSRALRGLPGMSEETRKAVLETAKKLGYHTMNQQMSLAIDRIPVFPAKPFRFVFILNSSQAFIITQHLLQGIQDRLAELGHKLDILAIPGTLPAGVSVASWAEKHGLPHADGLFLPPGLPFVMEQQLMEWKLPKIMINFPPPDAQADSVIWDVTTAIYQSVRYFTSMGHRRIMYIGDIEQQRGYRQRWIAFNEAMRENGLETDPSMHMIRSEDDKEEWMKSLGGKLLRYKPTGLLCGIGANLVWIYYVCGQTGMKIPDDLSLIALETMRSESADDLSRPVLPVKTTCERAVDRMLWRIGNPSSPYEHIRIQGSFHAGSTVIAVPQNRPGEA